MLDLSTLAQDRHEQQDSSQRLNTGLDINGMITLRNQAIFEAEESRIFNQITPGQFDSSVAAKEGHEI